MTLVIKLMLHINCTNILQQKRSVLKGITITDYKKFFHSL